MLISQVRGLTPYERLRYWITEREAIRLKKEAGQPFPVTDDEILQQYRFTNVRRMDDRVSVWLLDNWYRPFLDHPNMLYAAALARFFNNPDTLGEVTNLVFHPRGNPSWGKIKARVRKLRDGGATVFRAAYMVRGNDGVDKVESVVDHNVRALVRDRVRVDPSSAEVTHGRVAASYGFGSFMAGQVVADLVHAVTGSWADRWDWAPIGPGSRRGMNVVMGRDAEAPLDQDQFLRELRELRDRLTADLPASVMGRLVLSDLQNCLCEQSKYHKALFGGGRPKQRYPGRGT